MKKTFSLTTTDKRTAKAHHFFAASIAEWRVGADVATLIAGMKREPYDFVVYLVPGDLTATYEIKNFLPAIDGLVWIGRYTYEGLK